jgi:hypothetical protein
MGGSGRDESRGRGDVVVRVGVLSVGRLKGDPEGDGRCAPTPETGVADVRTLSEGRSRISG